ncbi:DNA-processing protein DprA [Halalkalibacillus halophilus]|uniref:DNA-processing protein DprA n=1 Tax=Halalkalibacillus halophilus TaxID=392827 RepID=UPI0004138BF7|nr:DNA-processing protein DprA [Halalkalibacillus halophilus]
MNEQAAFKIYILLHVHRITRRKIHKYLQTDPLFENLLNYSPNDLQSLFLLKSNIASTLYKSLHDRRKLMSLYDNFNQDSIVTWFHKNYPPQLKLIPDPPLILYYQGDLSLLSNPSISVIGSRKPSEHAFKKMNYILQPLIEERVTIISGLAYGIDIMAHKLALSHTSPTVAVLGSGLNHIYPKSHIHDANTIANKHLLLSEYPPETPPNRWQFPERNRIISGLSKATLIIEATEKSGTMITADQALEQGKDVFVIPDSIFLTQAKGCLKLLNDGAIPITTPEDMGNWWRSLL